MFPHAWVASASTSSYVWQKDGRFVKSDAGGLTGKNSGDFDILDG